jgi:hypothetical protein
MTETTKAKRRQMLRAAWVQDLVQLQSKNGSESYVSDTRRGT